MVELRDWREDDAEVLASLLNNEKIKDNLRDGFPSPYTAEDALRFIKSCREADAYSQTVLAITYNGGVVGCIGVYRKDNIHSRTAEMGYYVGERFWGRGIVTEAVRLACGRTFASTDIVRIFAEPFAENIASCRVLEKNGFVLEGILRKNAFKKGVYRDMKMYAKIKE